MDNIPYEFVDRVFTKLNADDTVHTISVETPVWKEVARVYKERTQLYYVSLCLGTNSDRFSFTICDTAQHRQFTLNEALQWDSRFKRVCSLYVSTEGERHSIIAAADESLADLLDYVTKFNLTSTVLANLDKASTNLQKQMCESDLRTESLRIVNWFPGGEEFLRKQLRNDELESLTGCGFCDADLKADIEPFVCRQNFRIFHFNAECIDVQNVKSIIASWRTTKPRRAQSIRVATKKNLYVEFASWMTPTSKDGKGAQFTEEIGNYNLRLSVKTDVVPCRLEIKCNFSSHGTLLKYSKLSVQCFLGSSLVG